MAQVQRKRTLINPHRRKRRNARRKLSAAQIKAGFGGKRRQNAKRRHKPASRVHRRRRVNAAPRKPKVHRATHRRRTKRRTNPGGIVEVALLNPAPKRRTMAKRRRNTKRRRHHAVAHRRHTAARTNPHRTYRRRRRVNTHHRRKHYRRNPSIAGVGSLVTSAAYAIAGAVGSKYLTQAVLGSSNTGFMGYGANLVAAFAMGKLGGMFIKNKQAENAIILGGVIQTVLRVLVDMTPIGAKLAAGFQGMGDYQATTIFSPVRYLDPLKSAAVDLPASIQPRMVAAAGGGGMKGLAVTRDTYSRGNSTY